MNIINIRLLLLTLVLLLVKAFLSIMSFFSADKELLYQNAIGSIMDKISAASGIKTVVTGSENLRPEEGALIVANNKGDFYFGSIFPMFPKDKKVYIVADYSVFSFPFSLFTKEAGYLKIGKDPSAEQANDILRIIKALKSGKTVFIFINLINRYESLADVSADGASYIALMANKPVIPVGMSHKEGKNKETVVNITIGERIYLDGNASDDISIKQNSEVIIKKIEGLITPEI